jgi:hypothetical protein
MPSNTSTSDLGTSSGLALQIDFTKLCSQIQLASQVVSPSPSGSIFMVGGTRLGTRETKDAQFTWAVTRTGETTQPPDEATLYLLAAYILLHAMPQPGLQESCRALGEIFEYHTFRPLTLLPPSALPRMKAKMRPATKQSGFQIEAE